MSEGVCPMKITQVERILLDVPFVERVAHHMNRYLSSWSVVEVCKVTTDTGHIGYGETIVNYTWGRVSPQKVEQAQGKNPFDLLWDDSLGAGLQMALYDLCGKIAGVPCYRLLGPKVRDRCPISWWAIDMPPEDWKREAEVALGRGYTSFKLKARPWRDIFAQVSAICEVVPSHFKLDIDFNGLLLNTANALPVLTELEKEERVAIFETPIPQEDVEGNRFLRSRLNRPIAHHFGSPPVRTALREDVCDGFVIGGGVNSILRQGTIASMANKTFWLQMVGTGLTTALCLHLGAVLSHAQWPAITLHELYSDDLLMEPIRIEGGQAVVPEGPGLGVEVDLSALERYRVETLPQKSPPTNFLYRVVWPEGRSVLYAQEEDYQRDFYAGNQPVFIRGVRLEEIADDGSLKWRHLREQALRGSVTEYKRT